MGSVRHFRVAESPVPLFQRLLFWSLFSGVALLVSAPSYATDGIECGCAKTGDYVDPVSPVDPQVNVTSTNSGTSPNGVYQLVATQSGVTITRGGTTVLTFNPPAGAQWGFSPDDDRFVYHYMSGSVHNVLLYNLAGANPALPVKSYAVTTSSARVEFSPNGRYFSIRRSPPARRTPFSAS